MSDRTHCNYCRHRWLRERTAKQGKVVTLVTDSPTWPGWTAAYVHERGRDPDLSEGSKDFAAAYLELPKRCSC